MKSLKLLFIFFLIITQVILNPFLLQLNAVEIQSVGIPFDTKGKIVQGQHKVIDDVGNNYYYVNNEDIGNPISSGYGDFKVYYKNDHNWKFTFEGEQKEGVAYFMVVDKGFGNIHDNTIVFCIQPMQEAEWIDDTNEENSYYNELSASQRERVDKVVSLAISEFSQTGNFDFLTAGQMLVWESVGARFISYDETLEYEKQYLAKELSAYDTEPSFANTEVQLNYNPTNKLYEANVKDTNKVLDDKYLSGLVGKSSFLNIEDGPKEDDLYIWSSEEFSEKIDLSREYNPLPSKSGEKLGVYYETEPRFVNSGQDLVTGLSHSNNFHFTINLEPAKGSAHLKKCGQDILGLCENLSGIKFGLYNLDDELLKVQKTNEEGEIEFNEIGLGQYYVKEMETEDKFELDNTKYSFSIVEDNQRVEINNGDYIENKLIKGRIKLTKVGEVYNNDNSMYPLKGVEFKIYKDNNKNGVLEDIEKEEVIQTLYTDEKGEILSNDLEYGNYIIAETLPIEGYLNNGYQESFKISENNQVIELYGGMDLKNDLIKGKVDLYKASDDNLKQCKSQTNVCINESALQGVRFVIYEDVNANQIIDSKDVEVQTLTTNQNGYAISNDLKYGDYILKEVQTLEGYVMSDKTYPFTIKEDGEIIHINQGKPIINYSKKGRIKIKKIDEERKSIEGVRFNIYNDKNNNKKIDPDENFVVEKLITNEEGIAISDELKYGNYILKEVQTLDPFLINKDEFAFSIDKDENEMLEFEIINYYKKGNLKIIKKDLQKNLLEGATFEVYKDLNEDQKIDAKDQRIISATTDESGEITLENLSYGTYLVKETKAPEGYLLNNEIYNIEIKENDKDYVLEVYNNKLFKSLVITAKNNYMYLVVLITLPFFILAYSKGKKKGNYI